MVNDAQIVIGGLGWLIVNALLLALAGFGGAVFELPSSPYWAEGGGSSGVVGETSVVSCATLSAVGAATGGAVGGLLGFGVGGIAGSIFGGALLGSFFGCGQVQRAVTFVLGLVDLVLNFFGFLFNLMVMNIPEIPKWLNAIIVLPPGAGLAYVGLKTIRGT